MSNTVTRLIEALNAPETTTSTDWATVEMELGVPLPSDYKELMDRMGGGRIEYCRNKHFDLVNCHEEQFESYRQLFRFNEKPKELQVEGSQIIPWATTDNGEWLFWRVLPEQNPDEWPVMLSQPRGNCWEFYDMKCTDFLYAALTKEIVSDVLWDQFPLENHVFTSFTKR